MQVLVGTGLEPSVGRDTWWDRVKGLCKVEGDQGKGDNVRNEGGSHEGLGGKSVMSVPGVPVLIQRTVPSQVEE